MWYVFLHSSKLVKEEHFRGQRKFHHRQSVYKLKSTCGMLIVNKPLTLKHITMASRQTIFHIGIWLGKLIQFLFNFLYYKCIRVLD